MSKTRLNTRKRKQRIHTRKKYHGGATEIDVRQILISEPIQSAVRRYKPEFDFSQYKISRQPAGFGLARMNRMMEANLPTLLQSEPVELRPAVSSDNKPIGGKIDGVMRRLYEIQNGRHRVARTLIDGHPTIQATILDT